MRLARVILGIMWRNLEYLTYKHVIGTVKNGHKFQHQTIIYERVIFFSPNSLQLQWRIAGDRTTATITYSNGLLV
jgi:hypothetical protein